MKGISKFLTKIRNGKAIAKSQKWQKDNFKYILDKKTAKNSKMIARS